MLRWIIFIAIFGAIDFYAFQAFKTVVKSRNIYIIYIVVSVLVMGNLIYQMASSDRSTGLTFRISLAIGFFLTLYIPKLVLLFFMLGEDIFRFPQALYRYFSGAEVSEGANYLASRRKFVSQVALGVAAIPFVSLLYGMYRGKYNFKVLKYVLELEDLPDAFDGYRITQISDIHSGSFDNREKVEYGVNLINEQAGDLILFTGDMVNNLASEMEPWKALFSRLNAKDGVYSVLGNHDYGDYIPWNSEAAKRENLEHLKAIQKEMGFTLLLNESTYLERNNQRIALIGVENWGAGGFKKAGDLNKAIAQVHKDDFKILMSHDPSHWEHEVLGHDYHFHLTLSGHTHGMQFGIEIPGWVKWSPVKWRYKYWAGIYKQMGQYINVNRGFGFIGYPGRVGIWPEITVIELKKPSNAM